MRESLGEASDQGEASLVGEASRLGVHGSAMSTQRGLALSLDSPLLLALLLDLHHLVSLLFSTARPGAPC